MWHAKRSKSKLEFRFATGQYIAESAPVGQFSMCLYVDEARDYHVLFVVQMYSPYRLPKVSTAPEWTDKTGRLVRETKTVVLQGCKGV